VFFALRGQGSRILELGEQDFDDLLQITTLLIGEMVEVRSHIVQSSDRSPLGKLRSLDVMTQRPCNIL
jgi:hypothetical protein